MPFFLRYIFHFFAFKLSFHLDQKKSWAKRRKKNFTPYILKHFNKNSWRVLKKTQRREKHAILCAYIDCLYLIYSQNKKNEQKKNVSFCIMHIRSSLFNIFSVFIERVDYKRKLKIILEEFINLWEVEKRKHLIYRVFFAFRFVSER